MTPDFFLNLVERFGLPLAMLLGALGLTFRAWTRGDFISKQTYLDMLSAKDEQYKALILEKDKQIAVETERRKEEEDRTLWWRNAWGQAAQFVQEQQGITRDTQDLAKEAIKPIARRAANRESGNR